MWNVALRSSRQLVPLASGKEFLGSGLPLWGAVLISQLNMESVGLLGPGVPVLWRCVGLHVLQAHSKTLQTPVPEPKAYFAVCRHMQVRHLVTGLGGQQGKLLPISQVGV